MISDTVTLEIQILIFFFVFNRLLANSGEKYLIKEILNFLNKLVRINILVSNTLLVDIFAIHNINLQKLKGANTEYQYPTVENPTSTAHIKNKTKQNYEK